MRRDTRLSQSALILAAHGSREEPAVNRSIEDYAEKLAQLGLFDEVAAAFNQGDPAYAAVIDRLEAEEVTVVPVMTSAGYFSDVVLPRELARNERFGRVRMHLTAPVGSHPRIVSIAAQRVCDLLSLYDLDPSATTVAVIGHGTGHHEGSRDATIGLAKKLGELDSVAEVITAFLDEEPGVECVCERASKPSIIVVPFFIGAGLHCLRHIPTRLGIHPGRDAEPPLSANLGDRLVICDVAVGTSPEIVDIIKALAQELP